MPHKHSSQSGFAALEAVLLVVIVAIIGGTGYFVYHANKKTNSTFNSAAKVAQSTPQQKTKKKSTTPAKTTTTTPAPTQAYFTITEWGVRAPYNGTDTLTYRLNADKTSATAISKQLVGLDAGCATFGAGQIARLSASDVLYDGGPTIAQAAVQDPGDYGHVGNYYYHFVHDQAACGNISAGPPGSPTAGEQAQNAANSLTQSLVTKLQALPQ